MGPQPRSAQDEVRKDDSRHRSRTKSSDVTDKTRQSRSRQHGRYQASLQASSNAPRGECPAAGRNTLPQQIELQRAECRAFMCTATRGCHCKPIRLKDSKPSASSKRPPGHLRVCANSWFRMGGLRLTMTKRAMDDAHQDRRFGHNVRRSPGAHPKWVIRAGLTITPLPNQWEDPHQGQRHRPMRTPNKKRSVYAWHPQRLIS